MMSSSSGSPSLQSEQEKSLEHILGFLHPLEVHILMGCGGGRAEALPEKRA